MLPGIACEVSCASPRAALAAETVVTALVKSRVTSEHVHQQVWHNLAHSQLRHYASFAVKLTIIMCAEALEGVGILMLLCVAEALVITERVLLFYKLDLVGGLSEVGLSFTGVAGSVLKRAP